MCRSKRRGGSSLDEPTILFLVLKILEGLCPAKNIIDRLNLINKQTDAQCRLYFRFLWDHWAHCDIFKNGGVLMYTLEGVGSVANVITAYEEFK